MKLGVSICAFNEKQIVPVIKQYEGIADRIMVAISKKPWEGDYEPDDTVIRAVKETKAFVTYQDWRSEHEQRNYLIDALRDMDYVITSHADTFFTQEDLNSLKAMELTELHYSTNTYTYWKDYDTVVYPYPILPTLIVRSDAEYINSLNIKNQVVEPERLDITCHHVSWVKSDEEILKKISSYHHAAEVQDEWFEKVWKKDVRENFAPTTSHDFPSTAKHSLPEEIRSILL